MDSPIDPKNNFAAVQVSDGAANAAGNLIPWAICRQHARR
jgi:hypothetical protein